MRTIGVIGTGNMGGALVKGWLRAAPAGLQLVIWDTIEAAATRLLGEGPVSMADSPEDLVARSDTVFVVVKPKDAEGLLRSLSPLLGPERTVVSSMAGVTLASLRDMIGAGTPLVRIMPNLGVEFGVGVVAAAAEAGADPERVSRVMRLLEPLGLAELLPEEVIDAVTAVSGSGPGFLALAIESMEDGAVAAGVARPLARALVRQAALDAAGLLKQHSDSPAEVRRYLASTGHLFAPGIDTLEHRGIRSAFQQAVEAAVERSRRSGGTHVSPR